MNFSINACRRMNVGAHTTSAYLHTTHCMGGLLHKMLCSIFPQQCPFNCDAILTSECTEHSVLLLF